MHGHGTGNAAAMSGQYQKQKDDEDVLVVFTGEAGSNVLEERDLASLYF